MAHDERGYLVVPHQALVGGNCEGCIMVHERDGQADLKCNACDVIVRTVPIDQAAATLFELASTEICTERCPHCGALNVVPGFSAMEAFICSECGEGVVVSRSVQ